VQLGRGQGLFTTVARRYWITCDPGIDKNWQGALDYVKCLNTNNYLGRKDWRLPNRNELRSLVHAGQADNSNWLFLQGISNVQSGSYWSSTTLALSPVYPQDYTRAWIANINSGDVSFDLKSNYYYVWPVSSQLQSADCTFILSHSSDGIGTTSVLGSITVTPSSSNCSWTATSNVSWISITSVNNGTGSGTVAYQVSDNTSGSRRSGTITIGGQPFTITQYVSGYYLKGDINNDGNITLADAIIAFQTMVGRQAPSLRSDYTTSNADVNADGRVGLPEVLYILQTTAGIRTDTDIPTSIIISANPDVILSDGVDSSMLTAKIIPFDQLNGVIPDGIPIEFELISGSATIYPSISGTIGGEAKTNIRTTTAGNVSVKTNVLGQNVTSVKNINAINSFSSLFGVTMSSSAVLINNYYQAGSKFSSTIKNNSMRTFNLEKFELRNGSVIVSSITDKLLLSGGQLSAGQSAGLTTTLSVSSLNNGITAVYYLSEQNTGKNFIVSRAF
jgi:hypothetical protein